jgi:hypothetical protein
VYIEQPFKDSKSKKTNMSGFSASITREVNTNVAKGRGPVGKSSRKTTYNNLLRTYNEEVVQHIRLLRTRRRCANKRSRVEDPHQLKWFLEDSRAAVAGNLEQFKYFSSLLKRKSGKQPSQSVVSEFVVFLLGCPQHNVEFGEDLPSTSKAKLTVMKEEQEEDDWGSGCGGGASMAVVASEWGFTGDTPNFDDEEDGVGGDGAW